MRYDENTCDMCGEIEKSVKLIWITADAFEPLEGEIVPELAYLKYDALCEYCYTKILIKNSMTKERARAKAIKYREWAEKAEKQAKDRHEAWCAEYKDFDWTQPILLGHHSQRRHERIYEKRRAMYEKVRELEEKAKRFREKAENLDIFANTNKGDAERKREAKRAENDKLVSVGDRIQTYVYGVGTVLKINKKTYTVSCDNGIKTTVDKSWIEKL